MQREEKQQHINNIIRGIEEVRSEVAGLSYDQFSKEEAVQESVYANLQMVGEAAHELSSASEDADDLAFDTDILAGFRNARYNAEAEISHQPVWQVVEHDLPELHDQALRVSAELGKAEENDIIK